MKLQRGYGRSNTWSKAWPVILALTAMLVVVSATAQAVCPDVSAQDISLGQGISVAATHCVINMTGFNYHRIVITGPDSYYAEHRFQTPPGTHVFGSPFPFPTPTVAGEYVVRFQFGVKFCFFGLCWWLWDDDSMVQTTFTVTGGTPPTIICPGNITQNTDPGLCSAEVEWTMVVSGDPMPTVTCIPASGSTFPQGTSNVTCTAENPYGSAICNFQVTVEDNQAPTIDVPAALLLNYDDPEKETVYDAWLDEATATDCCDPTPLLTHNAPALVNLPVDCSDGTGTLITWTATDASGNLTTCSSTVKLVDTAPPELSIAISPSVLLPANHKMIDIVATITVLDNSDPSPTVVLVSITSNEPAEANAGGDARTEPDIQEATPGTADLDFLLRAERQGAGESRVYTIIYSATDACGNTQLATAQVTVPHDRSKKK